LIGFFAILVIGALIFQLWLLASLMVVAVVGGYVWLQQLKNRLDGVDAISDSARTLEIIEKLPPQADFNVQLEGETVTPIATKDPLSKNGDSLEAGRFRQAIFDISTILAADLPNRLERPMFNWGNAYEKVGVAINPRRAFPNRFGKRYRLPDILPVEDTEIITEAMLYPDFEDPMYAALRDIDKELLIPNLNLIAPNSISLLETNPRFIESYMVGLNHEFGRELLWREYPTDMRCSSFRQFWDVRGVQSPNSAVAAEKLKDIPPIHTWKKNSMLGAHPNRIMTDVPTGGKQVILVIRGDLLKRYPNTVIYAQKAIGDGEHIREIDLTPQQFATELKFPQFRAEIDPDIRLFGFDLTILQAKGNQPTKDFTDKLGWFFVIQEVPGEARFGMDIEFKGNENEPNTWDNLAWTNFGTPLSFVSPTKLPTIPNMKASESNDHVWGSDSAQMAYILFQKPVMVAVHAKEMLKDY
jgi:hypothetical protein